MKVSIKSICEFVVNFNLANLVKPLLIIVCVGFVGVIFNRLSNDVKEKRERLAEVEVKENHERNIINARVCFNKPMPIDIHKKALKYHKCYMEYKDVEIGSERENAYIFSNLGSERAMKRFIKSMDSSF